MLSNRRRQRLPKVATIITQLALTKLWLPLRSFFCLSVCLLFSVLVGQLASLPPATIFLFTVFCSTFTHLFVCHCTFLFYPLFFLSLFLLTILFCHLSNICLLFLLLSDDHHLDYFDHYSAAVGSNHSRDVHQRRWRLWLRSVLALCYVSRKLFVRSHAATLLTHLRVVIVVASTIAIRMTIQ